jgi:phosphatidylserine/phosphatidylglycerophosphate/cardiolipin synthase-like enzyme
LIAHTNRAGEESLRKLELRLLEAGVLVARTADDLARYHDKMMIVDRRTLCVLAFNLTSADIERSRSFGVITNSREVVREAVKLFDADTKRYLYEAGLDRFVVSPVNARQELARFIAGAKKELLIYDPKISDPAMVRLLEERAAAGVRIQMIGRMARRCVGVSVRKLPQMRLHTRSMVRDGNLAFVGSQSLRTLELDGRREVGLIFREVKAVREICRVFRNDWALAEQGAAPQVAEATPAVRVAKKVAKAVARGLPAVSPVLDGAVREVVGELTGADLNAEEFEEIVKDAVKEAVRQAVQGVMEDVVEQREEVAS